MKFVYWILIGFAAQMIDGTLGMAYGVSCRTFLCTFTGLPSSMASAVVHCAEIPVSFVSGISHYKLKNVDKKLLIRLMIPGIIGGVIGAWVVTDVGEILEPFIAVYLILMGIRIVCKAFSKKRKPAGNPAYVYPLGFLGGFIDAVGGGGWGPVVTTTMVSKENDPRIIIGTVNTAEFFVTIAQTTAFTLLMKDYLEYLSIIGALVLGGVIAAPIASVLCKKLPLKPLMIAVGVLVIGLNLYKLFSLIYTH